GCDRPPRPVAAAQRPGRDRPLAGVVRPARRAHAAALRGDLRRFGNPAPRRRRRRRRGAGAADPGAAAGRVRAAPDPGLGAAEDRLRALAGVPAAQPRTRRPAGLPRVAARPGARLRRPDGEPPRPAMTRPTQDVGGAAPTHGIADDAAGRFAAGPPPAADALRPE